MSGGLQKFPVSSTMEAPTSVDYRQGTIGGVDSERKPWSTNIDRMASMNKDLRKSKACYHLLQSESLDLVHAIHSV